MWQAGGHYIGYPPFSSIQWMSFSFPLWSVLSVGNFYLLFWRGHAYYNFTLLISWFSLYFLHAPKNSWGGGLHYISIFYIYVNLRIMFVASKIRWFVTWIQKDFLGIELWLPLIWCLRISLSSFIKKKLQWYCLVSMGNRNNAM